MQICQWQWCHCIVLFLFFNLRGKKTKQVLTREILRCQCIVHASSQSVGSQLRGNAGDKQVMAQFTWKLPLPRQGLAQKHTILSRRAPCCKVCPALCTGHGGELWGVLLGYGSSTLWWESQGCVVCWGPESWVGDGRSGGRVGVPPALEAPLEIKYLGR